MSRSAFITYQPQIGYTTPIRLGNIGLKAYKAGFIKRSGQSGTAIKENEQTN